MGSKKQGDGSKPKRERKPKTTKVVEPVKLPPVETTVIEPEIVNEEVSYTAEAEAVDIHLLNQPESFAMHMYQTNADTGKLEEKYAIKFSIDNDKKFKASVILGTALDRMFSKLDLAKTCNVRLFDSRLPVIVKIESEHITLDMGKVSQIFTQALKVNANPRMRLGFTEKMMALTNDILKPLRLKDVSEVHADLKNAVQLRFGTEAKSKLIGTTVMQSLNHTDLSKLNVTETGVIISN